MENTEVDFDDFVLELMANEFTFLNPLDEEDKLNLLAKEAGVDRRLLSRSNQPRCSNCGASTINGTCIFDCSEIEQ